MSRWIPIITFVVLTVALSVLISQTLDRGPFQRAATGTELVYWQAAGSVVSGDAGTNALEVLPSPVFPHILALFWSDSTTAVADARRGLTLLFLPLFALVLFVLGWRRLGPWLAAATALSSILVAPIALHAGSFHPGLPAAILGLWALVVLDGKPRLLAWILAGLLVGFCARLEATLGWGLAISLTLAAGLRPGSIPRWAAAGVFAAMFLVGGVTSGLITQSPDRLPVVRGIEVYRGHAEQAPGVNPRRIGDGPTRWKGGADYFRDASIALQTRPTSEEVQAYWFSEGLKAPFAHPGATLNRGRVKLLASFQGDPLANDVSAAFLIDRSDSPVLRILVWVGRLLIPLGLVGLWLGRRRLGGILVAGAASGFIASLITFAQASTRSVTVGCLLLAAGVLVHTLLKGSGTQRLVAGVGGIAAVGVFGLWPALGGVPGQNISGEDFYQLGALYDRESRGSAALREYDRAMREEPGNPGPRFALAAMLARDNVTEEAVRELEAIREINREFYPGLRALCVLYQQQERWMDAAAVYGDVIALDPYNPEPLNNLGTIYMQIGYFDQSLLAFEKALELDPTYESAIQNLNTIKSMGMSLGESTTTEISSPDQAQEVVIRFLQEGNVNAAQATLNEAMQQFGEDNPGLQYAQGTIYLVTGQPESAIPHLEAARAGLGGSILFLNNLAAAYAGAGRYCESIREYRAAQRLQPNNERVRRSLLEAEATADSLSLNCD